jgi:integrase
LEEKHGITQSPFVSAKRLASIVKYASDEDGPIRTCVLTDNELRAVWRTAKAVGYPYGDIIRLLMISGTRLNDIGRLQWSEVDMAAGLISIPAKPPISTCTT